MTADGDVEQPGADAQWERVKAIFLELVDLPDDARQHPLSELCAGDARLRAEVESLLRSDRSAEGFCDRPAAALLGPGAFDGPIARMRPGSRLDAYEIGSLIAAGGMGEVYRAVDTRTRSAVAIKTVSAALGHPTGTERLLQEARHVATLAHPNICAIHSVGEADGVPYIVMALIEGRALSEVLHDGPLALDAAIRHAIDVTAALDHAHCRGIVHRDLKSSNVIIDRDGRAIVLDFGLAKRIPDADGPTSTPSLTGSYDSPPGTLTHMAPEVLRGRPADVRSDIWAAGVLMYHLVTGDLPFKGRTPFETSSSILGDAPPSLPRTVPLALRLTIERCLDKNPARRYQRASDVRAMLMAVYDRRAWPLAGRLWLERRGTRGHVAMLTATLVVALAGSAWVQKRDTARPASTETVAVFPLTPVGGSEADARFADGMTDALIGQLGAAGNIRVISRASAQGATTGRHSTIETGRALGATALVEGTLRRDGDRIHLDLSLVDVADGDVRWSGTFDRSFREVLVLQADAVRALVIGVDATLRTNASNRLTMVPSIHPDVYEAYLRGRYEWNQRTAGSIERAVEHFRRAVALDPTYAPAYAALADCYNQLGTVMVGSGSPVAYRPMAEAAAVKALQIDPDSAEAHAALGYVRHYSWQWREAEHEFLNAIRLNPSQPLPRVWYANLLMSKGRFDEALRQVHAARDVDPFSLIVNTNLGWILFVAGRNTEAIEVLTRAVQLDPAYPQARWRLADALTLAGRYDEALREIDEVLRLTHRSPYGLALLARMHAVAGRTDAARRVLEEVTSLARQQYVSPGIIPAVYTALGDYDTALEWIERAYDERSNSVVYLATVPWTTPLRADPRFQAVLAKVGLSSGARPSP